MMNMLVVIKRYLLFYLTVAFLYAFWSYVLDLIFIYHEHHSVENSRMTLANTLVYFIYFTFYYTITSLMVSMAYNVFVNYVFENTFFALRLIAGVCFGLIVGYLIGEQGHMHYIGQHEFARNMILFAIVGICVEILRHVVVKRRYSLEVDLFAID